MEVLLGSLITILTAIMVEYLRRPKLSIKIIDPIDLNFKSPKPAQSIRSLRLKVCSKALPFWAKWMSRKTAAQCHGFISFHHLDGQNIFGRVMPIRWTNTPEPVPIIFEIDGKTLSYFDRLTFGLTQRTNIPPGESEEIDVAVRLDNDEECFGWSNESYFSVPKWRNEDWKLSKGRYLVFVTIISEGEKRTGLFRLLNDVPKNSCRLESALSNDSIS